MTQKRAKARPEGWEGQLDLGESPQVESIGFVDQLRVCWGGDCDILESEVRGENVRSLIQVGQVWGKI